MQIICDKLSYSFTRLPDTHFLLDIETTGLLKTRDCIICIGVIYKKSESTVNSIQWFAEDKQDEVQLLKCFLEFCSAYQKVYTYNGQGFDIPFILSRLDYHDLSATAFKALLFVDMRKMLSKLGSKRLLLEKLLGYKRETAITGKEFVALYKLFEKTKLITYHTLLLNHHLEELGSLLALYEYYYTIHQIATYKSIAVIKNTSALQLTLQAPFSFHTTCSIQFEDVYLHWDANTALIDLSIQIHNGMFKKFLVPAKDYYLIKEQNQLVHKSVAQFIAKDLKQKVSQKECFVSKVGTFIRLYQPIKAHPDKWTNDTESLFIEYQDDPSFATLILKQVMYLLTSKQK